MQIYIQLQYSTEAGKVGIAVITNRQAAVSTRPRMSWQAADDKIRSRTVGAGVCKDRLSSISVVGAPM